jgi:hypothetical protein
LRLCLSGGGITPSYSPLELILCRAQNRITPDPLLALKKTIVVLCLVCCSPRHRDRPVHSVSACSTFSNNSMSRWMSSMSFRSSFVSSSIIILATVDPPLASKLRDMLNNIFWTINDSHRSSPFFMPSDLIWRELLSAGWLVAVFYFG